MKKPNSNMIEFFQGLKDLMEKHNVSIDIESESVDESLYEHSSAELSVVLKDFKSSENFSLNLQQGDNLAYQDFSIDCDVLAKFLPKNTPAIKI